MFESLQYYLSPYYIFDLLDLILQFLATLIRTSLAPF